MQVEHRVVRPVDILVPVEFTDFLDRGRQIVIILVGVDTREALAGEKLFAIQRLTVLLVKGRVLDSRDVSDFMIKRHTLLS